MAAGEKCEKLMGRLIVNVPVKDAEADEIWGFIGKKEKAKLPGDDPNFALGRRNQATTGIFIEGLRTATSSQEFQITTDGFSPYIRAIDNTLSDRVDFAQLIKVYRANPEGRQRADR